jgi:hypothetical protein
VNSSFIIEKCILVLIFNDVFVIYTFELIIDAYIYFVNGF